MKKYVCLLFALFLVTGLNACSTDDKEINDPTTENPDDPNSDTSEDPENPNLPADGKTLIVYYSYTNNIHRIVNDLRTQIEADVIRVEPAEEGLDYAANNYAIGSALIATIRENPNEASSYPDRKSVV